MQSPYRNQPSSPVDTGGGSDLGSDTLGPIFMRYREETSREEPWSVFYVGHGNENVTRRGLKLATVTFWYDVFLKTSRNRKEDG